MNSQLRHSSRLELSNIKINEIKLSLIYFMHLEMFCLGRSLWMEAAFGFCRCTRQNGDQSNNQNYFFVHPYYPTYNLISKRLFSLLDVYLMAEQEE